MKRDCGRYADCALTPGMPCTECTVVREPRGARALCDDEPTLRWSRPDGLPLPVEVTSDPYQGNGDALRELARAFVYGTLIIATVGIALRVWGWL